MPFVLADAAGAADLVVEDSPPSAIALIGSVLRFFHRVSVMGRKKVHSSPF